MKRILYIEPIFSGQAAVEAVPFRLCPAAPPEHPLWHFPNVIITPHISGSSLSPHFKTRLWDIVYENVRRFISDEPLFNELRPGQLSA